MKDGSLPTSTTYQELLTHSQAWRVSRLVPSVIFGECMPLLSLPFSYLLTLLLPTTSYPAFLPPFLITQNHYRRVKQLVEECKTSRQIMDNYLKAKYAKDKEEEERTQLLERRTKVHLLSSLPSSPSFSLPSLLNTERRLRSSEILHTDFSSTKT